MVDTPTPIKPEYGSLEDLANRIKAAHAGVLEASKNVVQKAIQAGMALREAKAKLVHGEWLPWLKDNCNVSERHANNYMKLAANKPKLDEKLQLKSATIADLTLTQALRLIEDKSGRDDGSGDLGKYDKAQATLIKKLQKLSPEDAEKAVQQTIQELQKAVTAIKSPAAKDAA
jgi:tRNA(Ile)-lysidine synthase TilS/MesJ